MSHWWAPGSPGPMWGLAPTNMFPSTQKDRTNVLEPRPRRPLDSPQQTPLPPSFKPLSILPDSPALPLLLLHIRASLSVATSLCLTHIRTSFPIFSSRLFLSLIPLCCCILVLQSFFLTWGSFLGLGECMALFVWCLHFIGFLLLCNRGTTFQIHQGQV